MAENGKPTFAIIHDLEHTRVNALPSLPLHVTVMRPFSLGQLGLGAREMVETVTQVGQEIGRIPLIPGETDRFGIKKDIPVTKVADPTGKLHQLHETLEERLTQKGVVIPNPHGYAYSPHIAHKDGLGAPPSPFVCDSLTITSWLPDAKSGSVVISRIPLF